MGNTGAFQSELYYQNSKVILTHPITSLLSECTFRLDNLKYCLGVGVAFKEIIEKHEYTYKCTETITQPIAPMSCIMGFT